MRGCTSLLTTSVIVLVGLAMPADTRADLPGDRTITYLMHETPTDPNSDVVFSVTLSLEAGAFIGDSVGWDVVEAEFVEYDESGDPDRTWTESDPDVPSADGRWWIDHADSSDPQASEFVEPPLLEGTADADDPADDDLDYSLEGVSYSPGPGNSPPYTDTGALDHEFALAGDNDPPVKAGQDEPVQTEEDEDPPV